MRITQAEPTSEILAHTTHENDLILKTYTEQLREGVYFIALNINLNTVTLAVS
jgi:hypothetical protein